MSKALIYTASNAPQSILAGGIVSPGSLVRRFGPCLCVSGNTVTVTGEGYYSIDASAVVAAAAADDISLTLYKDGEAVPGAVSTFTVGAIGDIVTLSIPSVVIRKTCCDCGPSTLSLVLSAAGTVESVAFKAVKE